nr:hypothetical protein [Treponema sp.]
MNLNKCFIYFFLLSSIFVISCSKKAGEEISQVQEPVISESFISGKILAKRGDLCLLGRDSEMHSVIKLSAGDEISILQLDGLIDRKFIPDSKSEKTKQEGSGAKSPENPASAESQESPSGKEYVHVVYDSMDFWMDRSILALNCENAVVIEKTYLYSDVNLTEKLNNGVNPLRFATLIAIEKKTAADQSAPGENSQSVKIFYYDNELKCVQEAYLSSSAISSREDDIVVSQIAEELKI